MSIPSWARKGAKVICIDAFWSSVPPANPLRAGAVYTISRAFIRSPGYRSLTEPFCELNEIDNPIAPGFGYQLCRFRPLVEDSEEDGIEARLFHAKGLKHHSKKPSPVEGETA